MKTIIAGSRTITDYSLLKFIIKQFNLDITEVVCGDCDRGELTFIYPEGPYKGLKIYGVDGLGARWAYENNIHTEHFPANWKELGRSAGPARNKEMAIYGGGLLLLWDGKSYGSKSMKNLWAQYGDRSKFYEFITTKE